MEIQGNLVGALRNDTIYRLQLLILMEKLWEQNYYQLEGNYWWSVARREIILSLISKFKLSKKAHILDIGCSAGCLIQELIKKGFKNVYGVDISEQSIAQCKKKGLKNIEKMDASDMRFNNNTFDLLISSDNLEHLRNDQKVLRDWNRMLKPNGILIVFVPAYKFLWSVHDIANYHSKRYSKWELHNKLLRANYSIVRYSYWNFILFTPIVISILLSKLIVRKSVHSNKIFSVPGWLNNLLIKVMRFENRFIEINDIPIGISIFFIARKNVMA